MEKLNTPGTPLEKSSIAERLKKIVSETRGGQISGISVESIKHNNCILMYGCKPQKAVAAETTMVSDVTNTLLNRFDRNTLTLRIPAAFEHLKGKDANFEMVTSNTLQPLNINYHHNIITQSVAYIFVSEKCQSQLKVATYSEEEQENKILELIGAIVGCSEEEAKDFADEATKQ